jgi:glycosyltransferase involved in cell wall biosynthesis
MNMSGLVSIITTVYNREKHLPKAIESVLAQTYSNFELIIWDDGSTDNSLEIAYFYAEQDSRIRIVPAIHQGRGNAVANACATSKGVYLGLLDSDDLLVETAIEEAVSCLEKDEKLGLVYTDYIVIDEKDKFKQYGPTCEIPYSKERLLVEFMVFHFRLFRRSTYEKVGGFEHEFTYCQDYDLCLKISEVSDILHLRRPLYYYRQHRKSISFEKRIEQLLFGKRAIENALARRGLTEEYELEFQIFARCTLYHQQKDVPVLKNL